MSKITIVMVLVLAGCGAKSETPVTSNTDLSLYKLQAVEVKSAQAIGLIEKDDVDVLHDLETALAEIESKKQGGNE